MPLACVMNRNLFFRVPCFGPPEPFCCSLTPRKEENRLSGGLRFFLPVKPSWSGVRFSVSAVSAGADYVLTRCRAGLRSFCVSTALRGGNIGRGRWAWRRLLPRRECVSRKNIGCPVLRL